MRAQTADDFCEMLSEAAEDCFATLNLKYARLQKEKNAGRPVRQTFQDLQREYQSGIQTVQDYLPEFKVSQGCLNQEGEVEVILEELHKDLSDLRSE